MITSPWFRLYGSQLMRIYVETDRPFDVPAPMGIEDSATLRDRNAFVNALSSQDWGSLTEIAHLNGYIVEMGERLGIATPANRLLTVIVRLMEEPKQN